jgi:hypothetical protein
VWPCGTSDANTVPNPRNKNFRWFLRHFETLASLFHRAFTKTTGQITIQIC